MFEYLIKPMESEEEIIGKAYVHYKSWHETYSELVDARYMENFTLEKCTAIARRCTDNIFVAKDGDNVVGFVAYGNIVMILSLNTVKYLRFMYLKHIKVKKSDMS